MPIEEAARQAGIPLEEVFAYVTARLGKVDTINWQLRLIGQESLEKSLKKLQKLANGGARIGLNFESTDLEAAKALAKIAMEAIKLSMKGGAGRDADTAAQKDLFEAANPWDLKKIE